MQSRILDKGLDHDKVIYIPNPPNKNLFSNSLNSRTNNFFINKFKLNNKFVILHSGNIGIKQGLKTVILTAEILSSYDDILFLIVGDGIEKVEIAQLKEKLELKNILFLPIQKRELLLELYQCANINLLVQKKEVVDIVLPSKLISMMATGSCIIASIAPESDAAKIIEVSDCGKIVKAESAEELAEAILYFYNNTEKIKYYKINSKNYCNSNFNTNILIEKIEKELIKTQY